MNTTRDLSLVLLAGLVAVTAMICTTVLAAQGRLAPEAVVALFTAIGTGVAVGAIGRLSGANATSETSDTVERTDEPVMPDA